MIRKTQSIVVLVFLAFAAVAQDAPPHAVTYEGADGVGAGKHIVYLASDHEYRGEETLPALARILAKRYGFKCTVLFGLDENDEYIVPGSSNIRGLDVLADADLMVVFFRFINMPDEEMQHIVDYVESGRPIVGLRTSTHAFKIPKGRKFHHYTWDYPKDDFRKGFGRQILGETWVSHYGDNHKQSSIVALAYGEKDHPILRGAGAMHVQAGAYTADPLEPADILAHAIVLDGRKPDAPVDIDKDIVPVAWTREIETPSGNTARVFTTTQGASEDIVNEGFRRMLVNAHLWCMGMDDAIEADNPVDLVGPYHPTTFSFTHFKRGIKPADLRGWNSPILNPDAPLTE